MNRAITYEPILRIAANGERALLVLPAIPDDAPDPIREAITRRRLSALTGHCPCGARCDLSRQQRRARQRRTAKQATNPARITVEHEHNCPASDDVLIPLLQTWLADDAPAGGRP